MPKLSLEVPHHLGRDEATQRLKTQLEQARGMVTELDEQWQDHTLKFAFAVMGVKVSGQLAVEDAAVRADVDLPMAAMVIKKVIDQRVREELGKILA